LEIKIIAHPEEIPNWIFDAKKIANGDKEEDPGCRVKDSRWHSSLASRQYQKSFSYT